MFEANTSTRIAHTFKDKYRTANCWCDTLTISVSSCENPCMASASYPCVLRKSSNNDNQRRKGRKNDEDDDDKNADSKRQKMVVKLRAI